MLKPTGGVGVLTLCITIFSSSSSVVKAEGAINIFQPPPNTKPYGLSYEEHVKNFYKWLLSMPSNENPVNDPTGQKCANGQTIRIHQYFLWWE